MGEDEDKKFQGTKIFSPSIIDNTVIHIYPTTK